MGELHLEVYIERMKREYGVDVVTGRVDAMAQGGANGAGLAVGLADARAAIAALARRGDAEAARSDALAEQIAQLERKAARSDALEARVSALEDAIGAALEAAALDT